jgi:hypothetical protein
MVKWISANLAWIVTSLAAMLMGFAANQVKTTYLESRVTDVEKRLDAHDKFADRLCRMEAIQGIGECKR